MTNLRQPEDFRFYGFFGSSGTPVLTDHTMRMSKIISCLAMLSVTVCACSPLQGGGLKEVDICVYGGTSAGVIAAYTARQAGKSVLLIEPGRHLGGMSSGGLGYTDIGNKYVIRGLALDLLPSAGPALRQARTMDFRTERSGSRFQRVHPSGGCGGVVRQPDRPGGQPGRSDPEYHARKLRFAAVVAP